MQYLSENEALQLLSKLLFELSGKLDVSVLDNKNTVGFIRYEPKVVELSNDFKRALELWEYIDEIQRIKATSDFENANVP